MKDELVLMLLQKGITLRDAKYAVTKYRILEYFINGLEENESISKPISKICNEIGISRATFFNYYSRIEDVFLYQIQIWIYKIHVDMISSYDEYKSKDLLLMTIDNFAELLGNNKLYMKYYIRLSTLEYQNSSSITQLTEAERIILDLKEDVTNHPMLSAKNTFKLIYNKAIENNEIGNILSIDEMVMLFHITITGSISYADIHRDQSLKEVLDFGVSHIIDHLKWS